MHGACGAGIDDYVNSKEAVQLIKTDKKKMQLL